MTLCKKAGSLLIFTNTDILRDDVVRLVSSLTDVLYLWPVMQDVLRKISGAEIIYDFH